MRNYGELPKVIGKYDIDFSESCFYLYMPIKMVGDSVMFLPERLKPFKNMIIEAANNVYKTDCYVYLTVKHRIVTPECSGNRPGYHSDGFMTDDINFIWSDCNPTIFNSTSFNLSPDELLSMKEMEAQALPENEVIYPDKTLLMLDQYNIHKLAIARKVQYRTFVKISFSKDRYDLIGNTHNYLIDYNWEMKPRGENRNVPQSLKHKTTS